MTSIGEDNRPVDAQAPRQPALAGPLLVTGATGGIGEAIARAALAGGVDVALLGRNRERVDELVSELAGTGGAEVLGLTADVSDERQIAEAVAEAAERLGPVRSLVTSAAIDRGGLLHELEPRDFDEVIAINLRGTYLACHACVPQMIESGGGSIVCVSSPLGHVATPGSGAYSASKAGIIALVRSLAVDYAAEGIRANALLPGPTETKLMWANVPADEVAGMRDTINREVPLGRLAEPAEVAKAALWLLSDDAGYVTGAQLACDGGVLAKASVSV
jgi:NAD(P)-dependent dehydrogenase (short-subunit alcohol dehydrogenase family)